MPVLKGARYFSERCCSCSLSQDFATSYALPNFVVDGSGSLGSSSQGGVIFGWGSSALACWRVLTLIPDRSTPPESGGGVCAGVAVPAFWAWGSAIYKTFVGK